MTRRLAGDLTHRQLIDRIVRVDHAGEYGARRIYEGQLAVLRGRASEPLIEHMAEQEKKHLDYFERALSERQARPTLLHPFWHVAGFALGAATALLSEKAAMACTAAVEEVIDEHYADQLEQLGDSEPELTAAIAEFRAEEAEHRDTAIEQGAEQAFAYRLLSRAINVGCRAAIYAAERV